MNREQNERTAKPHAGGKVAAASPVSRVDEDSRVEKAAEGKPLGKPLVKPLSLGAQIFCVFAGGLLGTAARAGLSLMQPVAHTAVQLQSWPWATFTANMLGALLLGFILELWQHWGSDTGTRQATRLLLGTGIMGAFTTYGTFIWETILRFGSSSARARVIGVFYALASLVGGLLVAGIGIVIARLVSGLPVTQAQLLAAQASGTQATVSRASVAQASAAQASTATLASRKSSPRAEKLHAHGILDREGCSANLIGYAHTDDDFRGVCGDVDPELEAILKEHEKGDSQ